MSAPACRARAVDVWILGFTSIKVNRSLAESYLNSTIATPLYCIARRRLTVWSRNFGCRGMLSLEVLTPPVMGFSLVLSYWNKQRGVLPSMTALTQMPIPLQYSCMMGKSLSFEVCARDRKSTRLNSSHLVISY